MRRAFLVVGLLVLCSGCEQIARVRAAIGGESDEYRVEPDYDLLNAKKASWSRGLQFQEFEKVKTWGKPSTECTSKETWTQRCGYHR